MQGCNLVFSTVSGVFEEIITTPSVRVTQTTYAHAHFTPIMVTHINITRLRPGSDITVVWNRTRISSTPDVEFLSAGPNFQAEMYGPRLKSLFSRQWFNEKSSLDFRMASPLCLSPRYLLIYQMIILVMAAFYAGF